jgi:hypothetical protein
MKHFYLKHIRTNREAQTMLIVMKEGKGLSDKSEIFSCKTKYKLLRFISLPDMIKMSPDTNVKMRLCLATWPHKQKISATTRRIDEMMKNAAALVTASETEKYEE